MDDCRVPSLSEGRTRAAPPTSAGRALRLRPFATNGRNDGAYSGHLRPVGGAGPGALAVAGGSYAERSSSRVRRAASCRSWIRGPAARMSRLDVPRTWP